MSLKKKPFNEGKTCDAVIGCIESREGFQRSNIQWPERANHIAPIEIACNIGEQFFAFEHTGIEPFAGHIKRQVDSNNLFEPIKQRLAGALPDTHDYHLLVPVTATAKLRQKDIEGIINIIVKWITDTAPTLSIAPPGRYDTPINKVTLGGVPFAVSLCCTTPIGRPGEFSVISLIDDSLEDQRRQRLQRVCNYKYPKLDKWKSNHKARDLPLNFHPLATRVWRFDTPSGVVLASGLGAETSSFAASGALADCKIAA